MAFCFHKTKLIIKKILAFCLHLTKLINHVKQGYSINTIYIKGMQSV